MVLELRLIINQSWRLGSLTLTPNLKTINQLATELSRRSRLGLRLQKWWYRYKWWYNYHWLVIYHHFWNWSRLRLRKSWYMTKRWYNYHWVSHISPFLEPEPAGSGSGNCDIWLTGDITMRFWFRPTWISKFFQVPKKMKSVSICFKLGK